MSELIALRQEIITATVVALALAAASNDWDTNEGDAVTTIDMLAFLLGAIIGWNWSKLWPKKK